MEQGLGLDTEEQRVLAASYLYLMSRDIDGTPLDEARKKIQVRDEFRKRVRSDLEPGKKNGDGPLEIEHMHHLAPLLQKVTRGQAACLILVELQAANPWKSRRSAVDDHVRRLVLKAIATYLGYPVSGTVVDQLDAFSAESLRAVRNRGKQLRGVLVGGSIGAVIGAALLAPHIGAAVGGTMGLSGAAATSAGLAALGGGSIAAGGLGMAGGTLLISSTFAITGAGAGEALGRFRNLDDRAAAAEAAKLYLTIRTLKSMGLTNDAAKMTHGLSKRAGELGERLAEERSKADCDAALVKDLEKKYGMLQRVSDRLGRTE